MITCIILYIEPILYFIYCFIFMQSALKQCNVVKMLNKHICIQKLNKVKYCRTHPINDEDLAHSEFLLQEFGSDGHGVEETETPADRQHHRGQHQNNNRALLLLLLTRNPYSYQNDLTETSKVCIKATFNVLTVS